MKILSILITTAIAAAAASAVQAQPTSLTPLGASTKESVDGGGRTVMRMADGGLISAYVQKKSNSKSLVFASSKDDGASWDLSYPVAENLKPSYAAVDSNFQGAYIAFVAEDGKQSSARIAYTTDPLSKERKFLISGSVTPAHVVPVDGFVQASRAGWGEKADQNAQTVIYGWQDQATHDLYVGISKDGKAFPVAKKVVVDRFAASGPSVGIRGNYAIVTYLTTNPAIVPNDVPANVRQGRKYQAWIETRDGGETWSAPQPLFGRSSSAYPQVASTQLGAKNNDSSTMLGLSGGTAGNQPGILVWESNGNHAADSGIIFVLSELSTSSEAHNQVGVVSFRRLTPGADWTHTIANNKLTSGPATSRVKDLLRELGPTYASVDAKTDQFQYSALVDTPVRASSYRETSKLLKETRLTVAISSDTGKTFNQHLSFSPSDLKKIGITQFDAGTIFKVSQCLYAERDGQVYLDIIARQASGQLQHAKLAIGVNAQKVVAERAMEDTKNTVASAK